MQTEGKTDERKLRCWGEPLLGPAGSAKSSAVFMKMLAGNSESCIVIDIKREFGETTAKMRETKFGHRIVTFDPVAEETDYLNPLDYIFVFFEQDSPAALSLTQGLILQLYPEPPEEGSNLFFRLGTRSLLATLAMAVVAVCPPEHRNLTTVFRALTNEAFLNELLMQAASCTLLKGEIAQMAEDQHQMAFGDDGAAKTFGQFKIAAMHAIQVFGPGNYLANITSKTTFDFAELKLGKVTAYITVDFANKDVLGKWAGMMLWLATDQLVRANNNTPVIIYHDECCNSPLYNLPTVLTLLRSYGVKYVAATQDLDDFTRVYGKHALETILSEADLKLFLGGIRSQTTLDYLSKYLGEFTTNTSSFAFSEDGVKESVSRTGRALQTADEVRRLKKDAQIVIFGNLKPILARKIQVFAVEPWRKEIAPNSMYGGKRYLKPVEVVITKRRAKATRRGRFSLARRRKWPRLVTYITSRTPVAALLIIVALAAAINAYGFPHLRWQYSFYGSHANPGAKFDCHYIGPQSFTQYGPGCPLVVFRKTW
ncbi:MAG: TraM recognition domain-containing protein [Rhodobacteraceae bacterium]|nr:TraM recognition domain-containing protein [Paracoccaceae bacterium]